VGVGVPRRVGGTISPTPTPTTPPYGGGTDTGGTQGGRGWG